MCAFRYHLNFIIYHCPFLFRYRREKFNTGLEEIEVPMMHAERTLLDYVHDDSLHYDSVSLPYSGNEYEMNVYLQHVEHGDHGSLTQLFHELARRNFTS